jgi:hypothetical protein
MYTNNHQDLRPWVLRSTITMPTKNFFPLSLTPTHSSNYPFLYTTHKCPMSDYSTGISLNCQPQDSRPGDLTSTSLNCNFAQTPHDMPSSLDGGLGLLGQQLDNMPSGCMDSSDPFGHLGHLGHLRHLGLLGHLRHLGLLGHLSYLNTLNPKPIDIPLSPFMCS